MAVSDYVPSVIKAKINLEIFEFSFPLLCYLNSRRIACKKLEKKSKLVSQKKKNVSKYRLPKFER